MVLLAALGQQGFAINVASETLAVTLDEQAKGAVARLVSARGQELGAEKGRTALFGLTLCRTDCYTNMAYASADDATSFAAERLADGVRLVYGFAGGAVEKVVCTVRAPASRRTRATRASRSPSSSAPRVRTTRASSALRRAVSIATPARTGSAGP